MAYTVYVLRDKNGKVYVGATSQPVKRRWNHGNGYRKHPELWLAIKSQGWDTIRKEIELDKTSASRLEQELIEHFESTNPIKGYNRDLGGLTNDKELSVSTRNKISVALLGEKNANYGKHFSEEHRQKIAESNRGKKRSYETCIRIGKAKEKPVAQYSANGIFIAVYESARKAALATGVQVSHISKVCKHQRMTAGGYMWCYD